MSYLLDTNACIGFLNGHPRVLPRVLGAPRGSLSVSALTEAELVYGAEKSSRVESNRRRLTVFFREIHVLPFDRPTAREFGRLKAKLAKSGRPIPDFDLGIAATSLVHGAILVSRDRHMRDLDGIAVEDWQS